MPPYPSSHADCVGEANAPSVSSRGTRVTSGYMPKSFHSLNVKGVYLEEWLHVANAHVPAQPGESGMRRLGDSAAPEVGELIVIVDSVVECQRRSPWVTWGQFPLFPVGDPPPLSQVVTRVRNSPSLMHARVGRGETVPGFGSRVLRLDFDCVACARLSRAMLQGMWRRRRGALLKTNQTTYHTLLLTPYQTLHNHMMHQPQTMCM